MYRTAARVTGALFITATVAGILGAVLLGDSVAGSAARLSAGALMIVVMAAAVAMIPAAAFPVLRQHGEGLAVGYVAARVIEALLLLPAAIGPLVLVAVRADVPGGGDASAGAVRAVVQTQEAWGYAPPSLFFCLGALLLNVVLFRSGLVPRWISGWALGGVALYATDAVLVLFGVLTPASGAHVALVVPLAVNEMALAVWLLTRGFRAPPAVVPAAPRPAAPGVPPGHAG